VKDYPQRGFLSNPGQLGYLIHSLFDQSRRIIQARKY